MTRKVSYSLLLFVFACGTNAPGPFAQDWAVTARVALPTGAALSPDNPAQPGEGGPQALAYANGHIFVALTNLYNAQPAGPSYVSVHDPSTLEQLDGGLIPLVSGNVRCTNAGAMVASGDTILIACAGPVPLPPATSANGGMLVELSASQQMVTRIIPTGGSPGAIVQAGNNVWLADTASPSLLRVDATTGDVLNGADGGMPIQICQPDPTAGSYASDLVVTGGRAFASCLDNNTIQEFDPDAGTPVGAAVSTGTELDAPVWMASIAGQLAVVGSTSASVGFASLDSTPIVMGPVVIIGGGDLQSMDGDAQFAAVANSGYGTVDILDVAQQFKLVAAVDTKDSPAAPDNYPYGVIDVGGVFYVTAAAWTGTPELLRIEHVDGGT